MQGYKTIKVITQELFPKDENIYELKLITGNQLAQQFTTTRGVGIRMDPERTLASYRLKEGDKILVSVAVTQTGIWRSVGGSEQIAVIIRCPNNGISKTMKFAPTTPISEVKLTFLQKVNLYVAPRLYGMYIEFTSDWNEDDLVTNEKATLSTFPLPTPARLICKAIPRQARPVFGVNPATLPMVTDLDCSVPEVVVILKELLQTKQGLYSEGIFRKAGSELEMKVLKQQIENGENIVCDNIHSVATMLKRWYKELPERILVNVDIKTLVDNNQKCTLQSHINPVYASLLTWLFRLLLIPVQHYETTLMDPKNLGTSFK